MPIKEDSMLLSKVIKYIQSSFNSSTWDAKAGGSSWLRGQPNLYTKFQATQDYIVRFCLNNKKHLDWVGLPVDTSPKDVPLNTLSHNKTGTMPSSGSMGHSRSVPPSPNLACILEAQLIPKSNMAQFQEDSSLPSSWSHPQSMVHLNVHELLNIIPRSTQFWHPQKLKYRSRGSVYSKASGRLEGSYRSFQNRNSKIQFFLNYLCPGGWRAQGVSVGALPLTIPARRLRGRNIQWLLMTASLLKC